ncbi:triose-phosphate isomerase [archaeon]|nr:triose-phosphate isomerase [archaeon]
MSEDISPLIVLNLKTYENATGKKAAIMANDLWEAAEVYGADLVVAAQATDINEIKRQVPELTVYAQHIDSYGYGAHTGHITAEAIIGAGASGTLLNHSEKKIDHGILAETIKVAQDRGLEVIACADSVLEAEQIADFGPNYIAVEPPELIGGDVSVTTRPQLIVDSVETVRKVDEGITVLVGAGVKTYEDVSKAMELKTDGVLLASGITKAEDPVEAFKRLIGR